MIFSVRYVSVSKLPDLRHLVDAVAVVDLFELFPQRLPFVLHALDVGDKKHVPAIGSEGKRLHVCVDLRERLGIATAEGDAPNLRFAARGSSLGVLVFAVGEEINCLAIAAPVEVVRIGAIERQFFGFGGFGIDDPKVAFAIAGGFLPAGLAVGDLLAVGRQGHRGNTG